MRIWMKILLAGFLVVVLLSTGCVSKATYEKVLDERSQLEEKVAQLEEEVADYQSQIGDLESKVAQLRDSTAKLERQVGQLTVSNNALKKDKEELSSQNERLAADKKVLLQQNEVLQNEVRKLRSKFPLKLFPSYSVLKDWVEKQPDKRLNFAGYLEEQRRAMEDGYLISASYRGDKKYYYALMVAVLENGDVYTWTIDNHKLYYLANLFREL